LPCADFDASGLDGVDFDGAGFDCPAFPGAGFDFDFCGTGLRDLELDFFLDAMGQAGFRCPAVYQRTEDEG
jgi:hypothetical protein